MTKQQEQKVNRIKQVALLEWVINDDYEIKKWEVEENEFFVSVNVEVGLKGDEGTLAAVFGRNSAHIFVGPKGGMTYWRKKGKNKRLKYINLWEVHCAQNH